MLRSLSILQKMRRFAALSRDQRVLVLRAVPTVSIIRLGLWLLHPSYVLRRVETSVASHRNGDAIRRGASVAEITWAVRASSRRIPGASCLVQALAARLLLARYGHDSALRIGVARPNREDLEAHAWIEVGGVPVIGGRDSNRYFAFPEMTGALPVAPKRFKGNPPE